jgi:hypothetical protein
MSCLVNVAPIPPLILACARVMSFELKGGIVWRAYVSCLWKTSI